MESSLGTENFLLRFIEGLDFEGLFFVWFSEVISHLVIMITENVNLYIRFQCSMLQKLNERFSYSYVHVTCKSYSYLHVTFVEYVEENRLKLHT